MKKAIILLVGVLVAFVSTAQNARTFNSYYRYGFSSSGANDSVNFATQNLWWYGPNGYRFSEGGVKYSLKSYIASHFTSTASPGGSDTFVQFNDGGSFGGVSNFQFDKTNKIIKISNAQLYSPGNNLFFGQNAGNVSVITNGHNIAVGDSTLRLANSTAVDNIGIGFGSLFSNTSGRFNVAIGSKTLNFNTSGDDNTALGHKALWHNVAATHNTAVGVRAMDANQNGNDNVAMGVLALGGSVNGSSNVAIGDRAQEFSDGSLNTAIGWHSMQHINGSSYNAAIGVQSLQANTSGERNSAIGANSLFSNVTGDHNTALGFQAGFNSLGSDNLYIGYEAGFSATGSNKLYITNNRTTPIIFGDFSTNALTFAGLAGTGTQMVTADVNGLLSKQAIPSGTIGGSLSSTQIAYGTGSNTIGSEAAFNYNSGTNVLSVNEVTLSTINDNGTGLIMNSGVDFALAANSGINLATNTGLVELVAGGGAGEIKFWTNAVNRYSIKPNGSWNINSSTGTSGQVLTSNGSGSTPTWQTATSGTVTSVTATSPMTSTGGATPNLALPITSAQVVYGTGSSISSEAAFNYDASTNVLQVQGVSNSGIQALSSSTTAFSQLLDGQVQIDSDGNGTHVNITETAINPPSGSSILFSDLQAITTGTSGQYTPTLTNVVNVSASTAYLCQWSRTGDMVTVSGRVDIQPTAAVLTITTLGISLPIASNFTTALECGGTAASYEAILAGPVLGDSASDRAVIAFRASDTNNAIWGFIFMYKVQ